MSSHRDRRIGVALLAMATLGSGSALAAPQNGWEEHTSSSSSNSSLGTFPVDCAASHNNNRGAIRYANPVSDATVISVWNLNSTVFPPAPLGVLGGPGIKSGFGTILSSSPLGGYQPSDRIRLSNTVGVSIGSGESSPGSGLDETYIEVFNLTAPIALSFPQYVESTPVTDPLWQYTRAGRAHDVELTRDSQWAVVNSDNWIHVVHIPSNTVHPFNIGLLDYSNPAAPVPWQTSPTAGRECTPNWSVDSVAVTNERAVVTTARASNIVNGFTTWVYVIDLSDPNGAGLPTMALQHEILPDVGTQFPTEFGDWPHDIAITPVTDVESGNDPLAVVTTRHSVACYNLASNVFLNSIYDKAEQREYQWQVDSVEMTLKVAITIGDRILDLGGGLSSLIWQVKFFELNTVTGINQFQLYSGIDSEDDDRAHDLGISVSDLKGLVRTSFNNVVLTDLTNPPPQPQALPPIPSLSDAHAYHAYASTTGYAVFSSDSVAIGTLQDDNGVQRLMAVSIGAEASAGVWSGVADIIDLNAATPSILGAVPIASNGTDSQGCVPTDLAVSVIQSGTPPTTEVVVRSTDPLVEAFNAPGPDLVRIQILPTASIGTLHRYGGSGSTLGLDSLAVPPLSGLIRVENSRRKLSIAQDEFLSPSGVDYIHIAN